MPKPRARRPQTAELTAPPQIPQVLAAAVCWRPIEALTPAPRNARTHPEGQLQRLISAIKAFGFTSPILVDEAANVLAGHGRLEAARRLGMTRSCWAPSPRQAAATCTMPSTRRRSAKSSWASCRLDALPWSSV